MRAWGYWRMAFKFAYYLVLAVTMLVYINSCTGHVTCIPLFSLLILFVIQTSGLFYNINLSSCTTSPIFLNGKVLPYLY